MKIKYPRTYHFDFSLGLSGDDKVVSTLENLIGRQIIVTEKMDGENSSIYSDFYHARSLDSANHESRSWLKQKQSEIGYLIPKDWRICGENLYAKHSLEYIDLKSYFYCFSIWDENNRCLSWSETEEWCKLLDIDIVPVLYAGLFDYEKIKKLYLAMDFNKQEGIVVRLASDFQFEQFDTSVVKAVRQNHVQTDEHWMNAKVIKNGLTVDN